MFICKKSLHIGKNRSIYLQTGPMYAREELICKFQVYMLQNVLQERPIHIGKKALFTCTSGKKSLYIRNGGLHIR